MTSLVLYGHPDSGHACKVALALSLAGLPHRAVWVDIWADPAARPADFLAASPFAEVPLMMIDGVPHLQSARSCWTSPAGSGSGRRVAGRAAPGARANPVGGEPHRHVPAATE